MRVTCFYTNLVKYPTASHLSSSGRSRFLRQTQTWRITTVDRCDLLLSTRPTLALRTCAFTFLSTRPAFVGSQDRQRYCHQATNTNTIPNLLAGLSDRSIQATSVTTPVQSLPVVSIHHLLLSSHTFRFSGIRRGTRDPLTRQLQRVCYLSKRRSNSQLEHQFLSAAYALVPQ